MHTILSRAAIAVLLFAPATRAQTKPGEAASPTPAAKQDASPKPAPSPKPSEKKVFEGASWREIGPFRGGRSVTATGVAGDRNTYYFGGTGGGLFNTPDAGATWKAVSDGQIGTGSVGAVAVAESDPNVVYVGMGEGCIRGNVSYGDGVYRSNDAGKTWTHLGLKETRQIGKIRVHPKNADLVYVAALGHAFGPNKERGVFRSKDGGKNWDNVLFVDERTGAIDLAMDPVNPRILFAAFWQVVRKPWTFESGGPGSALYKSVDGGDTWEKVADKGLPSKGVWGRIGVAVSPANHDRVWAIIEAEDGGVFRSDDGGKTWSKTNEDRNLRQRAWYYSHVVADPKNAESVYVLNVQFWRSLDGGKTFTAIDVPHGDNHDLWIDPVDSRRMVYADDGGAAVSFDGGTTWSSQNNQATAQFYHVIADHSFPYILYGAQQDNSTLGTASRTAGPAITAGDWFVVGGCESGYIAPHPTNADVSYAGCYDGVIERFDRRTGQLRGVNVHPDNPMGAGAEAMKYRFQWTFPIFFSPHDPNTLYAAGNMLFRTTTEGQTWEAISPDLTRNDASKLGPSGGPITKDNTSVEYYGTIFAAAESRLEKGLLWAGSDDGLVHVSRDGGVNWSNVTPPDLQPDRPLEWSMVSQIDPSPHAAGTAYVAVNRYKHDDYRPLVYVTKDYGKTWTQSSKGIAPDAFVRAVREDPVRPGLLFAGTEQGVYVSFDDGKQWRSLQLNLPAVPITDLVVKDNDLAVATQGRSFWVLDDIAPLRQSTNGLAAGETRLYKPSPAYRFGGRPTPTPGTGTNPPYGASIYYELKNEPKEEEAVALEFLDASGKLVRRVSSKVEPDPEADEPPAGSRRPPPKTIPAKAGLNRYYWDLRHPDAKRFKGMILWGGDVRGPLVVPGQYQVRLTLPDGKSFSESFEVRKDPRLATTAEAYQKQFDLHSKIAAKVSESHEAIVRIRAAREQIKAVAERPGADGKPSGPIADAGKALVDRMTAVEEALYQTKNRSSQDPLNYPIRLTNKMAALGADVGGPDAAPTDAAYVVFEDLAGKIDAELVKLKSVFGAELDAFNALVREQNVPAVSLKK
jgi:photosystem II stability/assembly factor-like uncharacterized protein